MGEIFFLQAEVGIRVGTVTGVQTCALPICGTAFPTCCLWSPHQGAHAAAFCQSASAAAKASHRSQRELRARNHGTTHARSEERRVGKECKSRWQREH